jgi:tetratricopeptide (TPR) repeat protein
MEDAQALLLASPRRGTSARDRFGAAVDRLRLAMAIRELGDLEGAEAAGHDALDVFLEGGNGALAGVAYAELAHTSMDRDDLESASRFLELGLDAGVPSSAILTDAAITARMGMLAQAEARLEQADTLLSAAVMGLRRIGYRRFEAGVTGYLGVVDFEAGRLDRARDRLVRATELLRHDARARDMFAGWTCAVEVARGNVPGARRAASLIRPLRREDPASIAAHVLTVPLDRALGGPTEGKLSLPESPLPGAREAIRLRSMDLRLALRLVASIRGRGSPSVLDAEELATANAASIEVSSSGAWFRVAGAERVDCRRFRNLRLLLVRLAEHRLVHPKQTIPWEALVEAGWPGERILPAAARNRLKVAMGSLRKLGLRELIVFDGNGYYLGGDAPLVVLSD